MSGLSTNAARAGAKVAVARAVAAGTPPEVAGEACAVTTEKFGSRWSRRAEAYFWGVVRRRALRGQAPSLARRLVVGSFADELRSAGHSDESVCAEIVRLFGASAVPQELEGGRSQPVRAA
jgi:hypothetical protein